MTGKRAFASVAIAFALMLVAAPIAHAQDLTGTGTVTDTATDAVTDTTDGVTDTTTGTVDGTTDTVDNATGGATQEVTDTVDDTTGSVGDTAGDTAGSVGNTVNDTPGSGGGDSGGGSLTDPVTNTVKDLTGNNGGGGGGSTSGLIDGLLGGTTGDDSADLRGLTPDLLGDLVDEASNFGLSPVAAEGWIEGKTVYGADAYRDPAMLLASLTGLLEDFAADFATESSNAGDVHFSTNDSGPSLFADAGRAAVVAAKALAFPLALALGVLGFLAIQGRIGRKDPKLALAPVDTTEELLIFE